MWLIPWVLATAVPAAGSPGFAEFDRRAKDGERLNVVFFGASLTWGANATDPQQTSYRAVVARRLEDTYPQARFKCWDAAIGGTGSQLGVFRLDRDVMRHKPDLVFVDFSANDDIYSDTPETLASYESIIRKLVAEAKCPVVQVLFPFEWNVKAGKLDGMKRRDAHLAIAKAYNTAVGDAIELAQRRVAAGETTLKALWPVDGVHPGDAGYVLFADAAWAAFRDAVERKLVCRVPDKMLYADTYMTSARMRVSSLAPLPAGWRVGAPNVVSAYFDMLMSRWLDDETIASAEGGTAVRLKVRFTGRMVMVFGESTPKTGSFRAYIDGKPVERRVAKDKPPTTEFDAGALGRMLKGNTHMALVIAEGLDPAGEHTLEIEPVFTDAGRELRIESICVAGGKPAVRRAE